MLTSTSISAPLPALPSKRKLKPKAPNTAAIWDSLASSRGYKGKGKEKEQDRKTEEDKEKELEREKENANEIGSNDLQYAPIGRFAELILDVVLNPALNEF